MQLQAAAQVSVACIPLWLLDETYAAVGDLAETIALVLPPSDDGTDPDVGLSEWMTILKNLKEADPAERRQRVVEAWRQLDGVERYLFNKLITGGFRVGFSQRLMTRALSKATGVAETVLAHRLIGAWTPANTRFAELVLCENADQERSRPYPFFLAHPLQTPIDALGDPRDWLAERKWDGIRGQIVVRGGDVFVWSRGEDLVTDKFPEFAQLAAVLPDGTVLDGEILAWKDHAPLSFNALQTRIARTHISPKHLKEAAVALMAYDVLEWNGADIRDRPLAERGHILEQCNAHLRTDAPLKLSPLLPFASWQELHALRQTSRSHNSEGLMLKHRASPYRVGRRRGEWWKWKVDPLSVDAVLVYAEAGHGRRANLYTDFTFAVWNDEGELVPFTKAYSGLTDAEFR